jgi:two-component system sensor histidine kinase KdpD
MLYMACTVVVALRFGRPAWVLSVALSMVAYDYFFESPLFSIRVANWPNLLVFGSMLAIAQVVSSLVYRLRVQTDLAQARAQEASTLYALSRELARERTPETIVHAAASFFQRELKLAVAVGIGDAPSHTMNEVRIPIQGTYEVLGYLRMASGALQEPWVPMLASCAVPIAQALERSRLSLEMERARVEAEAERSRSALLSGVSHDLRTPLSAIGTAAALLSQDGELMSPTERRELSDLISVETFRLNHLVENILEITRLDRPDTEIVREWQPLEGVVGSTLTHLEAQRGPVPVIVNLPSELPLVNIDGALVEQLFVNLLENALKHAPGSDVMLSAESWPAEVMVEVRDRGPGVPEAARERVFEKFYQTPGSRGDGGIGLGLAICKAIVRAHGGRLWVEEAPGGGAAFRFTLPVVQAPAFFPDGMPA